MKDNIKWVLKKQCKDVSWIKLVQYNSSVANFLFDFHKGGKFLDQLSDYQFLKNDSAPWSQLSLA
jgi:hypothetical protein